MKNSKWDYRPIGELFEISAGKTMSAAARDGLEKTPFLRTSNVFWDEIDLSDVDRMALSESDLQSKLLRKGDMLVCEGGEIGRAAIWDGQSENMSFQNHLHRLRPKSDDINPRFVVYFLQSAFTQLGIFEGVGNKTTIPNLSQNRLAAMEIPHPELIEQSKIVQALSSVKNAINVHKKLFLISGELKAAFLAQVFNQDIDGDLSELKKIGISTTDWQVMSIESLVQRPDYGFTASATTDPIGPKFLRITDVQDGRVNWNTVPHCLVDRKAYEQKKLNPGDIVVARIGATTGKAYLIRDPEDAVFASYLIRLRTKSDLLLPEFLYYFMQTDTYWDHIKKNKGGRLKGGVNIPALLSLKIKLPSRLEDQHAIAMSLGVLDRKIELHRDRFEALETLFNSLLQKFMTGELGIEALDLSLYSSLGVRQ
jgi:type I restriction enzyme S subunit